MRHAMRFLVIMALCGGVLSAQGASKPSIEGVWKVSEIVVTGAGASTVSSPQPGLFIFTRGHYSIMYVPWEQTASFEENGSCDHRRKGCRFRFLPRERRHLRACWLQSDDSAGRRARSKLYGRRV